MLFNINKDSRIKLHSMKNIKGNWLLAVQSGYVFRLPVHRSE